MPAGNGTYGDGGRISVIDTSGDVLVLEGDFDEVFSLTFNQAVGVMCVTAPAYYSQLTPKFIKFIFLEYAESPACGLRIITVKFISDQLRHRRL